MVGTEYRVEGDKNGKWGGSRDECKDEISVSLADGGE